MTTYFGLDIGASSIKVCKSERRGREFVVKNIGFIQNPVGSVSFKSVRKVKLQEAVKKVVKEAGIKDKRVVVSVPESHVYSRVVEMPVMPDSELKSAIEWEAEQFIPVPVEEVELDYAVVYRPTKSVGAEKMLVYLVAAKKDYLESFVDFLIEVGLEPVAMENEGVALARVYGDLNGVTAVLHLGALTTTMSILEQGLGLLFSHAVGVGGVAVTRAMARSLSLELGQAEQYKRTYGLNKNELEGKVREAILVVFTEVVNELKKALQYYENTRKKQVQRVLLSGGGAYMPELISYLTESLPGLEVGLADPFVRVKVVKNSPTLPTAKSVYSIAVGLSLKSF